MLHGVVRAAECVGAMSRLDEIGGARATEAVTVFESKVAFSCEVEVYAVYI